MGLANTIENAVRARVWPHVPEPLRQQIRRIAARKAKPRMNSNAGLPVPVLLERRYKEVIDGTASSLNGGEIELCMPEHADSMVRWSLQAAKEKGDAGLSSYMN